MATAAAPAATPAAGTGAGASCPVVHQLRQSVGLQRGMLVAGPGPDRRSSCSPRSSRRCSRPYEFNQLRDAAGAFGAQQPPSSAHLLGTTVGGYDVLSRVIWGTRTALFVIVVAVLLSIVIGVLLGLVSGYFGGWLDRVLVVVCDAIYAFPSLLLAIVVAIVISGGQSSLCGGILAAAISITVDLHPAVLPGGPRRGGADQGRGVRRVGQGDRRRPLADHVPARAPQRDPHAAADRHAQRLRGDPHPRRPGLPRLRHRADRGRRVGLRPAASRCPT